MNIFITGSSQGLGRELVYQYAKLGNTLGLAGRDYHKMQELQVACQLKGAKAYIYNFDLKSSVGLFNRIAQDFISNAGGIDLLILNAGIGESSYLKNSTEYLMEFLEVNFLANVKLTNAFIRCRPELNFHIVLISTIHEFYNSHIFALSKISASKYIEMLEIALPKNHYTIIYPGFILTKMLKNNKARIKASKPNAVASKIVKAIQRKKRRLIIDWKLWLIVKLLNIKFLRSKLLEFLNGKNN